jgi:uncharacterized protein YdhG (YjbR/CyaY superfamily)
MNDTKPAKRTATSTQSDGFTDEERAAMKERAKELRTQSRRSKSAAKADGASEVLAKIAEMSEPNRVMAERIHEIVTANAPTLQPRLWYGMPAYAKDGAVLCFFQSADKFKSRYATFGFNDNANLDDGTMWATAFALTGLTADVEARIVALVTQAAS